MLADEESRPGLGIGLRVLSGVLFTGMLVCIKAVSDEVPVGQSVFFRSLFALLPIVVFLMLRREFPQGLATRRPLGHALRSGLGAAAMFASFAAVALLPVAETTLLAQLTPVFMALGGVLLLGERFSLYRAGAIALALAGVAVLVLPGLEASREQGQLAGYALGALSALLTAGALLTVRRISRTETAGSIAFYFILVSALAGLATLPLGWAPLKGDVVWLLVLSGLFGGSAHIAMTLALRYAEASRLAPFEYIALVWPVLADWLLFGLPVSSGFLLALPLLLSGVGLATLEGRRIKRLLRQ
ncbi:DMT family transporter [Vreelandella venusta]|uniref:DMT family transporter n=1 Tax=Vreelandella venusta TaxID=44935 RepID=A0AAP9ZDJ1_9GAMM|nr:MULTISPECIES: DMT family transporter [Halomonas]MBR9924703.1 DMT family transporter [Gammaproteobacteria bacterium]AZM94448.1 DMT family transporter [Halomonas venusta]MDX1353968.1 DMT family transporter [Halomonas venusta]MDX1712934.1 DMT family transporter [Halomonas venusta]NPT31567.1 EamA/RhaT family transporter [Halomonas venusta]